MPGPFHPAMVLLSLMAAALAGPGFAQETPRQAEIDQLVKQLGDNEFAARERALQKLIDLGAAALPALERAAQSRDAEVVFRAKRAIRAISFLEPAEQTSLRAAAEEAVHSGDNREAVRALRRLCGATNASLDDHRRLGHVHQLGGRWKQAVAAYTAALAKIDRRLDKNEDFNTPAADGFASREQLLRQRAALIVILGRIQRNLLDDPQAAAATYALAARHSDVLAAPLEELADQWRATIAESLEADGSGRSSRRAARHDAGLHYPLVALRELADTQEQLGRFAESLETWRRVRLTTQCYYFGRDLPDLIAIERLLRAHKVEPNDAPPGVVVVDPAEPTVAFDLQEAGSLARAYANDRTYWSFCLMPPAGKEFATLHFDCDIEQLKRRYGGQFNCWAMVGEPEARRTNIGNIGWPSDRPLGREVRSATFQIEPGIGAVYFKTGAWDGKFRVHKVKVTAAFRPRAADAELSPRPTAGFVIQNECLPKGGRLTLDGDPYYTDVASHDVPPGRHTYSYTHPERAARQTYTAEFKAGARYGLFINLDSPLESKLTNLRGFVGESGIARRKDGSWLAAWQSPSGTIRFASSDDLVTWSEPWQLPESGLYGDPYQCLCPSLYTAPDGTLWMAYFSNRLDLDRLNTGGYRLFLSHSQGGRKWSSPRPLRMPIDGWPPGSVRMTTGPDGDFWMFYRLFSATAESPGEVTTLELLEIPGDESVPSHARNPHATFDADGRLHLVWDHFGQKLFYSRRDRHGVWLPAVELPGVESNGGISHPRLLVRGKRALLLHARQGAVLYPARITEAGLDLGEAVKITDHVAPLSSVHLPPGGDGLVAVLCGEDTVWIRSTDEHELFEKMFPDG